MPDRARPVPDADSQPFWDGAREGRLRIQRCPDCGRHVFYPRAICPVCMSDRLEWVTASGSGVVYSFTIVHRAAPAGFADDVPYAVGLVDLDEGVRMMARLDIEAPEIGQQVAVAFRDLGDGISSPVFRGARA